MTTTLINPDMLALIKQLAQPINRDAVQRASAKDTRKGYDTTGFGYQFIANRFNEVCGTQWGCSYTILNSTTGKYGSGTEYVDVTVDVGVWVLDPTYTRNAPGGHRSASYADALKGAMTNGFKKAAALWGVGREAYEGTIDDDNLPAEDKPLSTQPKPEQRPPQQVPPPQPPVQPAQRAAQPGSTITKGQYDILMLSVRRTRVSDMAFRAYLTQTLGIKEPKEVKQKDLNQILEWLETSSKGGVADAHGGAMQ